MQNYRPFTGITPAVKILLILNIVMYFLSMFIDSRMHVDTAHLLGLHLPQSVFWRPCLCTGLSGICFSICSLFLCSAGYWNRYGERSVF